ncbi:MAG: DoxX family protein [Candidatus Paceibacterota bacterium]
MTKSQKIILFLTRISLGWLFFYAGITKVFNPEWTSAGYLNNAKTFPELFAWFAQEGNIWWVDLANQWGLTLVGVALILGIFVRYASLGGILLMILYYIPALTFPKVGNGFIVDDHIIYIGVFLILIAFDAGKYYGLGKHVRFLSH